MVADIERPPFENLWIRPCLVFFIKTEAGMFSKLYTKF